MIYRYEVDWKNWNNTDDDRIQFIDYAKSHFKHVVQTSTRLYFNATPEQLLHAAHAQRIGTTSFCILTTSSLEPSTHGEEET
jgi:dihydrodipicolinate synthase/N-acetylneuraminate lyase